MKKFNKVGLLVFLLVTSILSLFLGEYLWNNVLVELVTTVKPVTSIWQILGLSVLISILFGGSI